MNSEENKKTGEPNKSSNNGQNKKKNSKSNKKSKNTNSSNKNKVKEEKKYIQYEKSLFDEEIKEQAEIGDTKTSEKPVEEAKEQSEGSDLITSEKSVEEIEKQSEDSDLKTSEKPVEEIKEQSEDSNIITTENISEENKNSDNPIKTPEELFDGQNDDDGYVLPALMVEAEKKKKEKAKSEIDTALEDDEFRKYYEKYYNKKSFSEVFWKDRKKSTRALIIIIALLLVIISGVAIYINSKLETLQSEPVVTQETIDEQIIYDEEELKMMDSINSAESLKDYLYQWANNNGEPMSSPNVINVLLLGLDSDNALENGGRSDAIILVSLNKKTEKINISSIYRDTWLYINVDGTEKYTKFNASYFYGGPEGTVKTFEENFKIKIDFYVTVDFSSFTNIINAIGGITLEVEEYEAKYINRTTVHTIDYGPAVKLNGWEALVYARIRKCDADSDVSRTRRQRKVITTLLNELKNASYSDMTKALSSLFGYVKTNLTKTEIISYMIQALKYNWMDYEIIQTALDDGEVFGTGWVGDQSTVFMDMPMVAYRLQEAVFENSNIVLAEDRATVFDTVNASRAPMPEETTTEETTTNKNKTEKTTAENEAEEKTTDINGYALP